MENKFIVRGISKKENKFVYGYYYYDEIDKKHCIKEYYEVYQGDIDEIIHNIIQEPDRFFCEINRIKYWENDLFEHRDHCLPYPIFQLKWDKYGWGNYIGTEREIENWWRKVGTVHFNKELLEKNNGK